MEQTFGHSGEHFDQRVVLVIHLFVVLCVCVEQRVGLVKLVTQKNLIIQINSKGTEIDTYIGQPIQTEFGELATQEDVLKSRQRERERVNLVTSRRKSNAVASSYTVCRTYCLAHTYRKPNLSNQIDEVQKFTEEEEIEIVLRNKQ